MGCCGQKRQALRAPTRQSGNSASNQWVNVEYRSRGEVEVRGPTGRTYVFSGIKPIQAVHPRDARLLLRSTGFRLL